MTTTSEPTADPATCSRCGAVNRGKGKPYMCDVRFDCVCGLVYLVDPQELQEWWSKYGDDPKGAGRYNHACVFAFEIRSDHPSGESITGAQFKAACRARLDRIPDDEMIEACWPPYDTFEEEESNESDT